MSKGTEPVRVEPMFGMVHEHAKMLAAMADAIDRQVVQEFNGVDLIANPGHSALEVERDWTARRNALQAQS